MNHYEDEQGTELWHLHRVGKPTASRGSDLITSTGSPSKSYTRYAEELAADMYAGQSLSSFEGNSATQRGNQLEPEALAYYSFERSVDVVTCGFFTDTLDRYGASPDGLVGDDGLIEIKNQQSGGHVKTAIAYHKTKKPPTSYIAQIAMQLLVTDRAWCDLVLYHPDLPKSIIRIERDVKFDEALKAQITACIQHRDDILKTLKEIAA